MTQTKPNVYVVRADYGKYTESLKREGYVGIGWFTEPIAESMSSRDSIKQAYQQLFPADSAVKAGVNVGQINRFLNEIKVGDIVITPYQHKYLIVGKVISEAYFQIDSTSPYGYRRKVEWFANDLDRHTFSIPLQNTLGSTQTCYKVAKANEIFTAIGLEILPDSAEREIAQGMRSEEVIYEQIRKRFLELDATDFEMLVSYVLRSLGFDATQQTGSVGDGGIDFEGELNVLGIASIKLQVQVKRYESNTIAEKEIRSFRGALKRDYQGCFITLSNFHKKAIESAKDAERTPINLIDGKQFTEIFIEQYDKIMEAIYEEDNEELASKLKFKKMLLPAV